MQSFVTFQVLLSSSNWLLDVVICSIMICSAVVATLYYGIGLRDLEPQASYAVYDAPSQAAARFFLPARAAGNVAGFPSMNSSGVMLSPGLLAAGASAAGNVSIDTSGIMSSPELLANGPGAAGRWQLPVADEGMDALADLLSRVYGCMNLWSAYGLLQCAVLLLILVRLLTSWSFQTRLGIITTTLLSSLPQLGHLILVFIVTLCLYAFMLALVLGARLGPADTYGSALYELLLGLLGHSELTLASLYPASLEHTAVEAFAVGLIYYTREFLFIMVLMQFFMVTIGHTFMRIKAATVRRLAAMHLEDLGMHPTGGSNGVGGIPWDVKRHVVPEAAAAIRVLKHKAACRRNITADRYLSSDGNVSTSHIARFEYTKSLAGSLPGELMAARPSYPTRLSTCSSTIGMPGLSVIGTSRAWIVDTPSAAVLLQWLGIPRGMLVYDSRPVKHWRDPASNPVGTQVSFYMEEVHLPGIGALQGMSACGLSCVLPRCSPQSLKVR
jgi:hypothetical protein